MGFIRNLPKELLAAFRATLEELHEADVLLHLIDVSNPEFEDHIVAVEKILEELGIAAKPTIRVFNKEDRIADKELLGALCRRFDAIAVSALNPPTFRALLDKLEWLIHASPDPADRIEETAATTKTTPRLPDPDRPSLPSKNLDAATDKL